MPCSPRRHRNRRQRLLVSPHGSDLPFPSNGILPLLGGIIDGHDFQESRNITNPIDKDARLKQMLGYNADSFTREWSPR